MSTELQEIPSTKSRPYIGSIHLSGDQINFLLAEFGQFKRPSTILSDFKNTFQRDLNERSLTAFQKRYSNDIRQVRDQWVNALSDEAGSHKRVRIVKLYDMLCTLEDRLPDIPGYYTDEFQGSAQYLMNNTIKQMESLLNSLRIEMEGNTLNINYRNLSTQRDDELIDTARDVLNKVDPSLIEDANYSILGENDDK